MTRPFAPYSVLVNSSDGFEDCWSPFFSLFSKYWPLCDAPIFLNTEVKQYSHPDLSIECTRVQGDAKARLTWSECLISALSMIETPLVLYFQEDYFLHRTVLGEKTRKAADLMLKNPEIGRIDLTGIGSRGPHLPYRDPSFEEIRRNARYRVSTQAALWRVDTLRSYLVPEENGWMFEIYGTWRSRRRADTFLCARFDADSGGPEFDYLHTGIIKGKWLREIRSVFEANGIVVDYSRRGFYRPKNRLSRRIETGRRLLQRPGYLLKQLL